MMKSKVKRLLSFSVFLFINPSTTFAQNKLCEIKYDEKGGAYALERKVNIKEKHKYLNEKNLFECYRIGLEHDEDRKPILSKPIYACCKEI